MIFCRERVAHQRTLAIHATWERHFPKGFSLDSLDEKNSHAAGFLSKGQAGLLAKVF